VPCDSNGPIGKSAHSSLAPAGCPEPALLLGRRLFAHVNTPIQLHYAHLLEAVVDLDDLLVDQLLPIPAGRSAVYQ
jgi:hypothetical protein